MAEHQGEGDQLHPGIRAAFGRCRHGQHQALICKGCQGHESLNGREKSRLQRLSQCFERPKHYSLSYPRHRVKVEAQVVDRVEDGRRRSRRTRRGGEDTPANACGRCSRRTPGRAGPSSSAYRAFLMVSRPSLVKSWPLRALRVGITQSNRSMPRDDGLDDVERRADAHQVARPVGGQQRGRVADDRVHGVGRLADAEAADGVGLEADGERPLDAERPQLGDRRRPG